MFADQGAVGVSRLGNSSQQPLLDLARRLYAIIGVRAQDCFTPEHTGLMVLGGFGLVVYVIGCAQHPSEPVQLDASASNWVPYSGGPAAFRS